jgi:mono/diheme cytochrome c family protein
MKTLPKPVFLVFPLLVLAVMPPYQAIGAQQNIVSSTPTYDPFAEPPLPENPTEYEMGRNLYWHWCMTCHGDRGQGLTDEFRLLWEPDHQNCWGRGCHGGRLEDEGFPIPTVVPALVNDAHLVRFASVQDLSEFLKATHPPQSPGVLKPEEYHTIAVFVFTMNERSLANVSVTETATPHPSPSPSPVQEPSGNILPLGVIIILGLIVAGVVAVMGRARTLH